MSAHDAGRELDALVAERVMGLKVFEHESEGWRDGRCYKCDFEWDTHRGGPGTDCPIPDPYSTDIAAAWEVVEQMSNFGAPRFVELGQHGEISARAGVYRYWRCKTWLPDVSADADTAPLAICLAALKLVEAVRVGSAPETPQG